MLSNLAHIQLSLTYLWVALHFIYNIQILCNLHSSTNWVSQNFLTSHGLYFKQQSTMVISLSNNFSIFTRQKLPTICAIWHEAHQVLQPQPPLQISNNFIISILENLYRWIVPNSSLSFLQFSKNSFTTICSSYDFLLIVFNQHLGI